MKKFIKNQLTQNLDMFRIILCSFGIMAILQFGEKLMELENVWAGVFGIGVSIIGYILTVIYLFIATPRIVKEVKTRLNK